MFLKRFQIREFARAALLHYVPGLARITEEDLQAESAARAAVIDLRHGVDFAEGHFPGSLNIALASREFVLCVGFFLSRVKHEVLNAKNHEREAEIIARAGEKGAITVATNMAGRGVDIILGGDTPKNDDGTSNTASKEYKSWQKKHDEVLSLGGLYIIGTERHESRRIDNQLRGRAGRQGDPGASRFFVALDDEIMRLFGGDTIANLMTRFNLPEDVPLEHPLVSRAIAQAQVKVEGFHFDSRKHLVEYDDVLNKQREIVYSMRRKVLEAKPETSDLKGEVKEKIDDTIETVVMLQSEAMMHGGDGSDEKLAQDFNLIIPFDPESQKQLVVQLEQRTEPAEKTDYLKSIANDIYEAREKQHGPEAARQIEQYALLTVIDMLWMNHLDAIENLRQGIGLRGYGQRDPLVEYKNEAYKMFETLLAGIDDEVVHRIYKIQIHNHPPQEQPIQNIRTNDAEILAGVAAPKQIKGPKVPKGSPSFAPSGASAGKEGKDTKNADVVDKKKLGRNDPCWCGSGKKFKKCHGK